MRDTIRYATIMFLVILVMAMVVMFTGCEIDSKNYHKEKLNGVDCIVANRGAKPVVVTCPSPPTGAPR